jgi:hypothetical protein
MSQVSRWLLLALVIGSAGFWLLTSPVWQRAGLEPVPAGTPNLDAGRNLFFAGACGSCHATPSEGDPLRLGGGRAIRSPLGTFYVPNISPDPQFGIGGWTVAEFLRALRAGVSPTAGTIIQCSPNELLDLGRADRP